MRIGLPRTPRTGKSPKADSKGRAKTRSVGLPPIAPRLPKHHQPVHRVVVDEGSFGRPTPPIISES